MTERPFDWVNCVLQWFLWIPQCLEIRILRELVETFHYRQCRLGKHPVLCDLEIETKERTRCINMYTFATVLFCKLC